MKTSHFIASNIMAHKERFDAAVTKNDSLTPAQKLAEWQAFQVAMQPILSDYERVKTEEYYARETRAESIWRKIVAAKRGAA